MSSLTVLFDTHPIRITKDQPYQVSVIDVISAISSKDNNRSGEVLRNIGKSFPEVHKTLSYVKFGGQGQRLTPVTDYTGLLVILQLLHGKKADYFRLHCVPVLEKHLFPHLKTYSEKIQSIKNIINTCPNNTTQNLEYKIKVCLSKLLHRAAVEVSNGNGKADIVTQNCVIELKASHLWKHALGQVLAYASSMRSLRPVIHLFGSRRDYKVHIRNAVRCSRVYGVYVTFNILNYTVSNKDQLHAVAYKINSLKTCKRSHIRRKERLLNDMQDVEDIMTQS